MKKIAIEEHFYTEEFLSYLRSRKEYPRLETIEDEKHNKVERMWRSPTGYMIITQQVNKLLDTGAGRLAEMDKAGIDMQILSLSGPGVDEIETPVANVMAKKINDELSKIVRKNPKRFAGFATVSPGDPEGAAKELQRAIKELGLVGLKLNSHFKGEYLDDRKFWPIFEMAEKLDVPVYLHPKELPADMNKYYAKYPLLTSAMWGFAADAGLHTMRLMCGGVFDTFPKLKLIMGHLGEAIPFWLWRIDNRWQKAVNKMPAKKPSEYVKNNIWVSTSGMFGEQSFLCVYTTIGADKIVFAVDYPYESSEEGARFIENVPICDADKERVAHLNVEKLFKL